MLIELPKTLGLKTHNPALLHVYIYTYQIIITNCNGNFEVQNGNITIKY